jgi:uncharacterized surface protein with fasciclin (FAS1) repeats
MLNRTALIAAAALAAAACQQGQEGNASAPAAGNEEATRPATGEGQAKTTILDTLSKSADHKTLVNAIRAAGLTETFSGAQPYTLFAPTDAAFQKLPAGTADGLLAPDAKGQLVALLTNHVVQGTVTAQDIARAAERGKGKAQLATMGGTNLSFSGSAGALAVTDAAGGQARVVQGDLHQSNGVIHSVDSVLMPKPAG